MSKWVSDLVLLKIIIFPPDFFLLSLKKKKKSIWFSTWIEKFCSEKEFLSFSIFFLLKKKIAFGFPRFSLKQCFVLKNVLKSFIFTQVINKKNCTKKRNSLRFFFLLFHPWKCFSPNIIFIFSFWNPEKPPEKQKECIWLSTFFSFSFPLSSTRIKQFLPWIYFSFWIKNCIWFSIWHRKIFSEKEFFWKRFFLKKIFPNKIYSDFLSTCFLTCTCFFLSET